MLARISDWIANRSDVVTLGAQGVIVTEDSRVLLIRHGYHPGWHFPGGGVERGEDIERALAREILEETGVVVNAKPRLFGIYSHFDVYPGDHIALFVIKNWHRDHVPLPNAEIAEQKLFPFDRLPHDAVRAAAQRLDEIFRNAVQSETW